MPFQPEAINGVNTRSSLQRTNFSYVTDLLDSRLSCACRADIRSPFDDPGNVEERANALNEVAYEKGKEENCYVGANEERWVGRAATPDY